MCIVTPFEYVGRCMYIIFCSGIESTMQFNPDNSCGRSVSAEAAKKMTMNVSDEAAKKMTTNVSADAAEKIGRSSQDHVANMCRDAAAAQLHAAFLAAPPSAEHGIIIDAAHMARCPANLWRRPLARAYFLRTHPLSGSRSASRAGHCWTPRVRLGAWGVSAALAAGLAEAAGAAESADDGRTNRRRSTMLPARVELFEHLFLLLNAPCL